MKLRSLTATKAILLAITAVVALIACSPSTRIAYHRWRLESIHKAMANKPSSEVNGLAGYDGFQQLDYHRSRLVDLGYLFHATYKLEPSGSNQRAYSGVWQATYGPTFTLLPWSEFDNETAEVWDLADKQKAWDRFFERVNREGWDAVTRVP